MNAIVRARADVEPVANKNYTEGGVTLPHFLGENGVQSWNRSECLSDDEFVIEHDRDGVVTWRPRLRGGCGVGRGNSQAESGLGIYGRNLECVETERGNLLFTRERRTNLHINLRTGL